MKILYSSSYLGKQKYKENYDLVLKALHATKVDVVTPEKNDYLDLLTQKEIERLQYPNRIHFEAVLKGIMVCDAVVFEMSDENFQMGHLATTAVENKKYILCVSIFEDFTDKIPSRYFFGAKYDERTIGDIVANFVHQAGEDQFSERFNLFLSPGQVDYLERRSTEERMNKSEYIRSLIDEDKKKRSPV